MKTFGKIIICIIVVIIAIGVAYLINNQNGNNANNTNANVSNNTQNNTKNETNTAVNKTDGDDYIGIEENVEPSEEPKEVEENADEENAQTEQELTGEEKAVNIVKKQYATNGQTVSCDHMEGSNYVIKVNDSTAAVTWYLVNGTTWEAEEY